MKLSKLLRVFRTEPLPRLGREIAWRAVRSTRKAAFRVASLRRKYPAHFRPIGYYQLQKDEVSAEARACFVSYAEAIVAGNFPLLGYGSPSLGPQPDWQCDWISGKSWPLAASGKLQIVRHDGSDVKAPWELSRLQWSPVVAKAWVLTGDPRYRTVLQSLLTDWIVSNPLGKGVNWTIAMEAALRGVSLCLTMELLWPFTEAEQPWLDLLEKSLWQHLRFIEVHNEFSWLVRSNHYLSNMVGLTTISACLQGTVMRRRCARYALAVQEEVVLQTYEDGGDREASSGYHVFVAQMALHSLVVQKRAGCLPAPAFEARLRLMFGWIATLADEHWTLPLLGDCDNGRIELLLDDIAQAGLEPIYRNALKLGGLAGLGSHLLQIPLGGEPQDAVWFGAKDTLLSGDRSLDPVSILPESGIAVVRSGSASLIFCAMPNGLGGKGSHTHCDKLGFILRLERTADPSAPLRSGRDDKGGPGDIPQGLLAEEKTSSTSEDCGENRSASNEVFCDTGSRCYTRSAELRNLDRSVRAHNTLSVDEAEQNTISLQPHYLFSMGNEAGVSSLTQPNGQPTTVQASHWGYARLGIEHRRTVQLCDTSLLVIDEVIGAGSEHLLDLYFTLGPEWTVSPERMTGERVRCLIAGPRQLMFECESASHLVLTITPAEISREFGASLPASSIRIRTTGRLPATLRTTVNWT